MEPDDVHRRRSILDQYQRLWRTQRVNFSIAVENQKESSVSLFLSIVWSFVLFDKRKKKKYLEAEGGRGRCKSLTKEAIKRTRLHYIMCAIIIKEFRERLSLVIFNSHIKSWKNLLRNTNQRSCARKRGNFVVDQFTSASLEHLRV